MIELALQLRGLQQNYDNKQIHSENFDKQYTLPPDYFNASNDINLNKIKNNNTNISNSVNLTSKKLLDKNYLTI